MCVCVRVCVHPAVCVYTLFASESCCRYMSIPISHGPVLIRASSPPKFLFPEPKSALLAEPRNVPLKRLKNGGVTGRGEGARQCHANRTRQEQGACGNRNTLQQLPLHWGIKPTHRFYLDEPKSDTHEVLMHSVCRPTPPRLRLT